MTPETGSMPASVPVVVSPMRDRHLEAVVAIESLVYPRPWSVRLFADELSRSGRCYLVAREGADVVGYAGLLMIADDGHVSTVGVRPDREGRGIATRLLVELLRGALALGAGQLTLEVRASNRRAQSLYSRFGFVPAGARKAYYGDNGEDAIVMWAHDAAADAFTERLDAIEASLPTPTVRSGLGPVDGRVGAAGSRGPSGHPARGGVGSQRGAAMMVEP